MTMLNILGSITFILGLIIVLINLFIGYEQTGLCKFLFHDIFHCCVPFDWMNKHEGCKSNCRYCGKRIVLHKSGFWKRY